MIECRWCSVFYGRRYPREGYLKLTPDLVAGYRALSADSDTKMPLLLLVMLGKLLRADSVAATNGRANGQQVLQSVH